MTDFTACVGGVGVRVRRAGGAGARLLDERGCDILHEVGYDGALTGDTEMIKVQHARGTVW